MKFEDEEVEALLDVDCCQTQEEIADSLGVIQAAISERLKRFLKNHMNRSQVFHVRNATIQLKKEVVFTSDGD